MTVVSKVGIALDQTSLIEKATRALLKTKTLIGIPDKDADRKSEDGEKQAASNAVIGYAQEFGSEEHNIPPRPFLVPGMQSAQVKIVSELTAAGVVAMNGGTDSQVCVSFERIGLIGQAAVQAKITDGPFTPLSPRTLAARRARGRTGEKPLIDTGQLRRSVTYIVESK